MPSSLTKAGLEASLHTLDILLIVFGVLVAIGVLGESIFGFMHWRRSNQLQNVQDSENLALQKEIETLTNQTQEAQKTTKRLEEKQAPWILSNDQKNVFSTHLKDAPKGKVAIEYIRSDEKRSRAFAVEVRDILKASGYEIWGYMAGFEQANSPPLVGVMIQVKNQQSDIVGGEIQRAFNAIGITTIGARRTNNNYEDDLVVVWIGIKP